MKKCIFVIGDLMIDHDIFVTEALGKQDERGIESVYEVAFRRDTIGGAGNSARALSVLNEGRTYLWGILGRSHWGTVREILERSHAIDGTSNFVHLRGIRDETDASMDTATRLIRQRDSTLIERKVRFYDTGHLHVTDQKRATVVHHLERVHSKNPIDAILVNDFGRACITREVVEIVSDFAARHAIPLFLDPWRDRERYGDLRATAVMPNLSEWCDLIGDPGGESRWRAGLHNKTSLLDMARRSFECFERIDIHLIKCDADGAVLITPHPERSHYYAVYRIPAANREPGSADDQIGSGDVMSAAFAAAIESETDGSIPTPNCVNAIVEANAVVAAYRHSGWHRMPSIESINAWKAKATLSPGIAAEISKGVRFLPKAKVVRMADVETAIPDLYSSDKAYRDAVSQLVHNIKHLPDSAKSLVLGAPPGSGKSTITSAITKMAQADGIRVIDYSQKLNEVENMGVQGFLGHLRGPGSPSEKVLVVVDEAWKGDEREMLRKHGVNLLNAAPSHDIKFLFVSAEFDLNLTLQESEFFDRCERLFLPDLGARLPDIPYIVASRLFSKLGAEATGCVKVEAAFLLAVTDYTLQKASVRRLVEAVDEAFVNANKRRKKGQDLFVRVDDAPKVADFVQNVGELGKRVFDFLK